MFVGQYLFTGSESSSVYLTVDEVDAANGYVRCTCRNDAKLKGVLLTVQVSNKGDALPTLGEYDTRVIREWAVPNEIDFISLSYCHSAEAVAECRACLAHAGGEGVGVMAKVERLGALRNIDAIVAASDGVILSRGNLGLDMPRGEGVFDAEDGAVQVQRRGESRGGDARSGHHDGHAAADARRGDGRRQRRAGRRGRHLYWAPRRCAGTSPPRR